MTITQTMLDDANNISLVEKNFVLSNYSKLGLKDLTEVSQDKMFIEALWNFQTAFHKKYNLLVTGKYGEWTKYYYHKEAGDSGSVSMPTTNKKKSTTTTKVIKKAEVPKASKATTPMVPNSPNKIIKTIKEHPLSSVMVVIAGYFILKHTGLIK